MDDPLLNIEILFWIFCIIALVFGKLLNKKEFKLLSKTLYFLSSIFGGIGLILLVISLVIYL
jgi:hypothetical protein